MSASRSTPLPPRSPSYRASAQPEHVSCLPDPHGGALAVFLDDLYVRLDAEAWSGRYAHLAVLGQHGVAERVRLQIGVDVFQQRIRRQRRDDVDRGEIARPEVGAVGDELDRVRLRHGDNL